MDTDATADLDSLSTEELRERAFALALKHRDVGFFWSVIQHLPRSDDTESLDSDLADLGASIGDVIGIWRELTGREGYGDAEPLLRAKFVDYLTGSQASKE